MGITSVAGCRRELHAIVGDCKSDLARRQVAVIAPFGPPAALAAKAASATIPIVFIAGTDPIDLGLVTNFRRPSGNVTGLNVFAEVLTPKRQELLHELVPAAPLV